MVELTPEQVEALRAASGKPVAALDPDSQQTFYIVTHHGCELLNELMEEERVLAAFADASWNDATARLREDP